jgi:NAD+ diphosphatase
MQLPFSSPPQYEPAVTTDAPGEAHWFVFRGDDLAVEMGPLAAPSDDLRVKARPAWARIPFRGALQKNHDWMGTGAIRTLYLGRLGGTQCWAAELAEGAEAPAGTAWTGLRALYTVLDDTHFALAGRALQLVAWDRTHQYCGRCGTPTALKPDERARVCPACKLTAYPRLAPAIMALVHRRNQDRNELLLGRSPHFPSGMYSALAGFVEPGESLEQCLEREVREEVGVRVQRIRYFASQPWPFPHSLMIAFVAEWRDGEIAPQASEIEEAKWFDVLQLPKLPSRISIARRLIDAVCQELVEKSNEQI